MTERVRALVESNGFGNAILLLILIAAVLVGVETYPEAMERWGRAILAIDALIIALFGVEAFLKMLQHGRRWHRYFRDPWNVFDFTILVLCLIPAAGHAAAVLRLARILRALRLVSQLPKLQLLVSSLLRSLPSMGYVGMLLGLLFYIYAVIGVFLFRENDPFHFGNLQLSLLTLFRIVTLEDWTDIMYIQMYGSAQFGIEGMAADTPYTPRAQPVVGALYFVSFVLLGTMIMLNLFIGVIVNSMHESQREAERIAAGGEKPPAAELFEMEEQLAAMQTAIRTVRERIRDREG